MLVKFDLKFDLNGFEVAIMSTSEMIISSFHNHMFVILLLSFFRWSKNDPLVLDRLLWNSTIAIAYNDLEDLEKNLFLEIMMV